MRTVILGGSGQLGSALQARAADLGVCTTLSRAQLDITDAATLTQALTRLQPTLVFNAAAYTAVDQAERDRDRAWAINAKAPAMLAQACATLGAVLIHYSTDYVFDGHSPDPYRESDPTAPINVYGASKLAGEQAVLSSAATALVLRTSWVYGDTGHNFAQTMLRLACERDSLRVVADQCGAPTWAGRLADLTCHIVRQAQASGDVQAWLSQRRGLYHACASGATNWAEYAQLVLTLAAQQPYFAVRLRVQPEAIIPITSAEYPTPAARPRNSRLDCSRLSQVFNYAWPAWQADLQAFVQRQLARRSAT